MKETNDVYAVSSCSDIYARLIPTVERLSRYILRSVVVALTLPCIIAEFGIAFQGYNVVVTTDPTCENQFLQTNQEQFDTILTTNPFVGDTYNMNLISLNPNYVLPGQVVPSLPCQLDQDIADMISASSTTYLYGWRDGATYFQQNEISYVGATENLCQNATNFTLINATTTTWNKATCKDALSMVINQIFTVQTGTPTIIPGEP